MEKVAVVTGSNKGIGLSIVKGLCGKLNGVVYLTARDKERGESAVANLKLIGLNPIFHQLDITDQNSIDIFRDHIKSAHGGIDILINNAGIAFKENASEPFAQQAEETVSVNYFGTLKICQALFPLLRNNAKVVNISSFGGFLKLIPSADLRSKFSNPNLTVDELSNLMKKFIRDAKDDVAVKEGWGKSCYGVSKVGISALTIVQQRLFDKEEPNRNVSINHVHPGWVDTDMTSHKGRLTTEEGAKAPLFLALEANFKGQYVWYDCQIVDWYGEETPNPW